MSYVDRHVAPGEEVVFRTRLHPVVFAGTAFFAVCVIGIAALIVARNELASGDVRLLWLAALAIAALSFVGPVLRWRRAEFAVTTRRVLVRVGLLRPHTVDVALPKPDAIAVEQPLLGRVLDYGTVRIGRAGALDEFARVAHPDAFRAAVIGQSSRPSARAR